MSNEADLSLSSSDDNWSDFSHSENEDLDTYINMAKEMLNIEHEYDIKLATHKVQRAFELKNKLESIILIDDNDNNIEYNDIIKNEKDINSITSIYENSNYILVNNNNTHYHTIGLWYYYGIPELVFESIQEHKFILQKIKHFINDNKNIINEQIDKFNDKSYSYDYDYTSNDTLEIVDEKDYLDYPFLVWFYSYFVDADLVDNHNMLITPIDNKEFSQEFIDTYGTIQDDGLEYQMFPIYKLN